MTTPTTPRIRWHDERDNLPKFTGRAGTSDADLFRVYEPDTRDDCWILISLLPGQNYRRFTSSPGDGPEPCKAEAERWLEEFVSSLGAVFPETYAGRSDNEAGTAVNIQPGVAT